MKKLPHLVLAPLYDEHIIVYTGMNAENEL